MFSIQRITLILVALLGSLLSGLAHASFTLPLHIEGQHYNAVLKPNDTLISRLKTSKTFSPDVNQHYAGYLADTPDSWVRISNVGGRWQGVASAFQQVFILDDSNVAIVRDIRNRSALKSRSLASFAHIEAACGLDHGNTSHRPTSLFATQNTSSALTVPVLRTFNELCANTVDDGNGGELCLIAELELAFDQEYQSTRGSTAASDAVAMVNIVDGIYRNNLNIAFETVSITMLDNSNDVFGDSTVAGTFLTEIRTQKGNNNVSFLQNQNALFHLVTGRDFTGSTVGVAYVDVVCLTGNDIGFTSGTSQLLGSGSDQIPLTAIIVAHELGHNFGAGHDFDDNSCSEGFIMFPSVNANATDFSSCSIDEIRTATGAIEDNIFRAPLNACFNFPVDLALVADSGNPTQVTKNTAFNTSFTLSPTQAAESISTADFSGSVNGGSISSVSVAGQTCNVDGNSLSFGCSLSNLLADTAVEIEMIASADTIELSLDSSVTGSDLRDIVSNNDSLTIEIAAADGGGSDTTPDQFTFTDQSDVAKDQLLISDSVSISGIDAPASISVTGGEYSIDGAAFTDIDGTIENGNSVRVRHTTASAELSETNTALTIGGVSDTFTSVTAADPPSDDVPDAFSFDDQDAVEKNAEIISNTVTISGIDTASAISVSNGEYSVNTQAFTSADGTVVNGDQVRVRHTSASVELERVDTVLTIGGVQDTFTSITAADPPSDDIPDAFSFTDQSDVVKNTTVVSDAITVSGIDIASAISVSNGEYSINNQTFTSADGTVVDGDGVRVRHTSANTELTQVDTVLTIGGVQDTFTSTTEVDPPSDDIPDAFSFTDQTDVVKNTTVVSNAITVSGIDIASPISVSNGEYSINGQSFTSTAATVVNGDDVRVRHTSASSELTEVDTVLTIGGVQDTFTSTTRVDPPSDDVPNAFSFTDQNDVEKSTTVVSNAITVSGIDIASAISVSNGDYSINGQSFTDDAGTVTNGDSVRVRHTSANTELTGVDTVLTIGGVQDTFSSVTKADPPPSDGTPNAFTFIGLIDVPLGLTITSNSVTISGIDIPTEITVSNGTYSINDGAFTSDAGTAVNGDQIRVRHTSSSQELTQTETTLTVGGVSDVFSTRTGGAPETPEGGSPDDFSFDELNSVDLNTEQRSNTITLSGLTVTIHISVINGEYNVNGSSFTSANGLAQNGDVIQLRHTSADSALTTVETFFTAGDKTATFRTTTGEASQDEPGSDTPENDEPDDDDDDGGSSAAGAFTLALLLGFVFWRRRKIN